MISSLSLILNFSSNCYNFETRTKLLIALKSESPSYNLLLLFFYIFDNLLFLICLWVNYAKSHESKTITKTNQKKRSLMFRRMSLNSPILLRQNIENALCLFICLFELFGKITFLVHFSYVLYRHSRKQPPILSKIWPFLKILNTFCFLWLLPRLF